jgi:hypothetical protein
MSAIRKTHHPALLSLTGLTLVVGLAACSSGAPTEAGSAVPSPSGSASDTASGTATPGQQPSWDPAGTSAWAAEAVPTGGSDGFVLAQNGHIEAGKPGAFTLQSTSLAAGDYALHFACRGDAETTVTVTVSNEEAATLSASCTGDAITADISTQTEGATFTLTGGNAGAVDWALALTEPLPR